MPHFSTRSQQRLASADARLQRLFNEVIKHYDCTVLCGHRGEKEQNEAFEAGKSQLKFPQSKHNSYPSKAVDVVPYPVRWEDHEGFLRFGSFVKGVAAVMDIPIRWGGDWADKYNDGKPGWDSPHYELKNV